MSIVRGIIEAHGGAISIDSDPGRGTTIAFTLPAKGEEDREAGR